MYEITGDILEYMETGKFSILLCERNCYNIVDTRLEQKINREYPESKQSLDLPKPEQRCMLNTIRTWYRRYTDRQGFVIVALYTSYYPKGNSRTIRYKALLRTLRHVNNRYRGKGLTIAIPRLGADTGGEWIKIKEIIKDTLTDVSYTLVCEDKPLDMKLLNKL